MPNILFSCRGAPRTAIDFCKITAKKLEKGAGHDFFKKDEDQVLMDYSIWGGFRDVLSQFDEAELSHIAANRNSL